MAKHEIEIPDGVIPKGWEPVSFEKPPGDGIDIVCADGMLGRSAHNLAGPRLILRRVEPVRESRWGWICCVNTSLDDALANSMDYSGPLVRADYEDGKCVFVGIENARPASIEEA